MTALNHQRPDRVPLCDYFWPEFVKQWRNEKGLAEAADIYKYYKIDTKGAPLTVDQSPWPSKNQDLKRTDEYLIYRDGWGRTLRRMIGITTFDEELELPIKNKNDFDKYEFESPCLNSRYDGLAEIVAKERKEYCVFFKTGGPYSRTVRFRGTQQFLMDMALDPLFVEEMVKRMTEHLVATMLEGIKRGKFPQTAVWIADDVGYKNGLLFSPKIYEKIFYPALKKICGFIKGTGRKVIFESEGKITEIFDMLIDAGVDVFACLEPRAGMDIVEIKKKYDHKISFIGNVCNVMVLPKGSKKDIEKEVLRVLSVAEEGGYIGGSAHSVGSDIPVENYEYMIELFGKYGVYPLKS